MAYVDGVDLKEKVRTGPLDVSVAVGIASQVAQGLDAAHQKSVIHRDIKSSNIMITPDGQAKIMDFGLAKIIGTTETLRTTSSVGTAAYMSPEQGRGEPVDHRSDIWSLGIVLYEMLSGELPFKGDYDAAVIYSLVNEEPTPLGEVCPETPAGLRRVVTRAMSKDPDDRYQSAKEMFEDLQAAAEAEEYVSPSGTVSSPGSQKSIAILPFTDVSQERELDYLCDGIAEEIINALTRVEGLRVVARTSAFSFKGKNQDMRDIGRALSVGVLLEGSVRKAGNKLRITAQLINASDGYHLWSERFDREMEDVFAIQDEITLSIVDKLKITLLGEEKAALVKRYTDDVEAYNLYLKGRFFWNKRTETGYLKGLEYFRQAIDKDPRYAVPYAGIADCYDLLGWYGYLAPQEAFPRARAAAEKALELDGTLAEAHASMGWISVNWDWEWATAEREYKRALELNPSYATAHQWYSEYLTYMGRHDESIAEGKKALELDPLSLIINNDLGQVYYFARRYDEAIVQLRKTVEMDPDFVIAHFFLALAYGQKLMFDEALREAREAMNLVGESDTLILTQLGIIHSYSGNEDDARRILGRLIELADEKYVSPFRVALIYMGLGEIDRAFEWLEKAYEERDHWIETLKVNPALDTIRADDRYNSLLEKTGLNM
jgi:serine/threonine-protein kinase